MTERQEETIQREELVNLVNRAFDAWDNEEYEKAEKLFGKVKTEASVMKPISHAKAMEMKSDG